MDGSEWPRSKRGTRCIERNEYLTKLALETCDGLVIHPLVGATQASDVPADVRFRTYQVLVDQYYPRQRTLLAAFPAAMRYAGPREALFHALVRKNYGIAHLIVGRDHAGVGNFYDPTAAQAIFDEFDAAEIGVAPLRFEPTFFCARCDGPASAKTCPHGSETRVDISGTRLREMLAGGETPPPEFMRPEVAEILRNHYSPGDAGPSHGRQRGTIVWLTGLPAAGKSTIAAGVADRLKQSPDSRVEVLDGDVVRTHLSQGLGFSREDRDTNIRRIGYVARLLARHGVIVIVAVISPYATRRDEVRLQSEQEGVQFLEVFVDAPLETLIARDPKGLYRKAIAGEIAHFTGVSDPYEAPVAPELHVQTDRQTLDQCVAEIVGLLID